MGGTDCSLLTLDVVKLVLETLPRAAAEQMHLASGVRGAIVVGIAVNHDLVDGPRLPLVGIGSRAQAGEGQGGGGGHTEEGCPHGVTETM